MKKDLGLKIRQIMVQRGIKTTKELTDMINRVAGKKIVTSTSVGRWLANRSDPKATSLMFLAKALNVSADLILYEEGDNPESKKSLERMVSTIVKSELEKSGTLSKDELNKELLKLLESDQIPQEEKDGILRQIRNLHKLYSQKSKGNDADSIK